MPKIAALGSLSSRGFGEFAQQTAANYIEDVFSTYLYTGTGSTQTITNNIDLSTKGGLLWTKARSTASTPPAAVNWHWLYDSSRNNFGDVLFSNDASSSSNVGNITPLTTGFTTSSYAGSNQSGVTYASWTFRKQPKFFDIITYTGDGTNNRQINHNLGAVPGMVIVKCTSNTSSWPVWNNGLSGSNYNMYLNATGVSNAAGDFSSDGTVSFTATTFPVSNNGISNTSGRTYIAYLFAHNAGGFGADGSQNVISCGSFTTDSGGAYSVNLGYEPQFILIKPTSTTGNWVILDNMRGLNVAPAGGANLYPNNAVAEGTGLNYCSPTATGFEENSSYSNLAVSTTYIYMAIRRGPMRTPTDATKVFETVSRTATNPNLFSTNLIYVDTALNRNKSAASTIVSNRLTGSTYLLSNNTNAEIVVTPTEISFAYNYMVNPYWWNTTPEVDWLFRRAPGFFDVVCFTTSNSTNQRITHNLGVAPELIITKNRGSSGNWFTYAAPLGRSKYLSLNGTAASNGFGNDWGTSDPTSTDFGYNTQIFQSSPYSGNTVVAYLFATCPGVSKVGSYTGTGATQTISCGFTGGARYVLIKRTDSTGDWWVWDTARGMVAGTDPRLPYNSNAAEANSDWVYTTTGGFQIVTSDATVNASGGSYIFLAIA